MTYGLLSIVNFGNNFTFETLGRCDYVLVKKRPVQCSLACMIPVMMVVTCFNKGLFYTNIAIVMIKL